MNDQKPYVTVTLGGSGWFAVILAYYKDILGYDIYQTGVGRFATRDEAIKEAKEMAEAEGVETKYLKKE